nr:putative capsid protein [Avon-Heathcote Estuary associated circular virus 5]
MSASGYYSGNKRKRSDFSADAQALAVARPSFKGYKRRRKEFVPGQDRTGGYYRFGKTAMGPGMGEMKFFDTDISELTILDGGIVKASMNNVPQGTGESQRIGRKCVVKSIYLKFSVNLPQLENEVNMKNPDQVRVILYLDKQANGETTTLGSILEGDPKISSFRNLSNMNRYTILMDKVYDMNYESVAAETDQGDVRYSMVGKTCYVSEYRKLNIPIEFSGTMGAIDEIRSNNIGLGYISANNVAQIVGQTRIRYADA